MLPPSFAFFAPAQISAENISLARSYRFRGHLKMGLFLYSGSFHFGWYDIRLCGRGLVVCFPTVSFEHGQTPPQ